MKFETRLFEIREKNDLNQYNIAKKLGVSRQNYSFWEIGAKFIPINHLNDFCNLFDFSMDYVMNLTNNKENRTQIIKSIDPKLVGNNIKYIRIKNNLTQKELATILNTTQSTISAYESGKTLLLTAFAYQLCLKYNLSMDWLYGKKKINEK